ncbi:MAG: AAA family ATPase [Rhabdochlamydiaceae bacterium]
MKSNILLFGPVGTGKTTSIRTIIENCNRDIFITSLEPGIETILGETDPFRVHWHYVPPAKISWEMMGKILRQASMLQIDQIIKSPIPFKSEFTQFLDVYSACENFICDRTGKEFGPVDDLGEKDVWVIDGLTSLCRMAIQLLNGAAILRTQPGWYGAQNVVENFLNKCTGDTKCSFILLAHEDRLISPLTGASIHSAQSLGNALTSRLATMFDEIIYSRREGNKFTWSTSEDGMPDLKARILPFSNNLEQDFNLILENFSEPNLKPANGKKGKRSG